MIITVLIRVLLGCFLGLLPGVLVARWNVKSGLAVGIAGAITGIIVAQFHISPKRFAALVSIAVFGNICNPLAESAVDATEDDRVDESEDWISNWVIIAWKSAPPKLAVSLIIVLCGIALGSTVSIAEYHKVEAGGMGILLPLNGSRISLTHQALNCGFMLVTAISSVILAVYSVALRRALLAAATIGHCLGAVIGISVGDWSCYAIPFSMVFAAGTIGFALLVMCVERQEQHSACENGSSSEDVLGS
ncbi:hypothetical protein AB1L42_08790 [Thalassoglobus sp. JC818]|uniref:hypothetical protein n=1 Tax=Thalassoglobus sp. JC818 TaxID=3232136 RepID=UPI0034573C7C